MFFYEPGKKPKNHCQLYEKFFALAPLDKLWRRFKRLYLFNPDPRAQDLDDHYYQETISAFKQ
ncbi:MAG: hypothetical protein PHP87_10380 [Syntrophomonas sp.]|uniref:hypothetical protein n=1 Tax=Syntrophomonas sp. TaxID=2053627 RepID=UPI0026264ABD|nr:hypothetical protein [Syntrophomonas sp.]MDD4627468.1 hypothetical protein [Syntrophomonas sp.]